jgi:diguanylate cyclase (GGDEF)-like protein
VVRFVAIGALWFLLLGASGGAAVLHAPPAKVTIVSSVRAGAATVYRLRVEEGKARVLILLADDSGPATLEVNGAVRQRAGGFALIGLAPLGHESSTFVLSGLGPRDRVVVRVADPHPGIGFAYDAALLADVHQSGFYSGLFYAVVLTTIVFEIVGLFAMRDPAIAWYLGFTLALLLIELAHDDYIPFGYGANLGAFLAAQVFLPIFMTGFSATYLRLRSHAPRLFLWAILQAVPALLVVAILAATNRPAEPWLQILPTLCGLASLIAIALLRFGAGYRPAILLVFVLLGITADFALRAVFQLTGVQDPFLTRWGNEIGPVFDFLMLSIGILFRSIVLRHERERMEEALSSATFSGLHDELTGILNRRGLGARIAALVRRSGTLLFIDVDGFKRINDQGGHAAGDVALKAIAQLLTEAVRSSDIVARVGGDEFVVFLEDRIDPVEVAGVVARIASAVTFMRPLGPNDPLRIGVSIGPAILAAGGDVATAIAAADAEAYRIKNQHYGISHALQRRPELKLQ